MGSQTISEEKGKIMSKRIQYWNGLEWEEKNESSFPGVDFKDILRIFWRGDKEIEAEYQKEKTLKADSIKMSVEHMCWIMFCNKH